MPRLLESTKLRGPAGPLEALHEGPDDDTPITRAAVICHPHPLFGGTMHNKVVFRLARAARRSGAAVLRFNFRGVGQSAGEHATGEGEQDDLRAALDYMRERYPQLPTFVAGFSFGARVALRVFCGDMRLERVISAGTSVLRHEQDWTFLSRCNGPKFFVQSTHDEYGPKDAMERFYAQVTEPKHLKWIESQDHFFTDALDEMEAAVFEAMTAKL